MQLSDILPQLIAWFPPDAHKERKLPGGGKWFFLPHQAIRDRLNEICPDHWSDKYTLSHREADGDPIYLCELTICQVTHTGIGDKSNEDSTYGTPAQRAFRKAFTDAAEQFGIAAYLDEQKGSRDKFLRYMQSKGDGRAVKTAAENGWLEGNLSTEKQTERRQQQAQTEVDAIRQKSEARTITPAQVNRLTTLATQTGYSDSGLRKLVYSYGFNSRKDITIARYDEICLKAQDRNLADALNQAVLQ